MEERLATEGSMRESKLSPGRDSADSPGLKGSFKGRMSAERGDLDLGASL